MNRTGYIVHNVVYPKTRSSKEVNSCIYHITPLKQKPKEKSYFNFLMIPACGIGQQLERRIDNAGVPDSKARGSHMVASRFHPSEVDQISTRYLLGTWQLKLNYL